MSKQKVAFIGLGVMGYPMAGHLAKSGFATRVYNRTAAKSEQWCKDYEGEFALPRSKGKMLIIDRRPAHNAHKSPECRMLRS